MPIVATLVTRIDPATDSVADEIFTPLIGVSATASFDTLAVLALAAVLLVRAPNPDCLLPLHERHRLQRFAWQPRDLSIAVVADRQLDCLHTLAVWQDGRNNRGDRART